MYTDVSPRDCGFCLRANLHDYKSCCRHKQGGAVIRSSCFIRWDWHPFAGAFEIITLPPPQPQSQPPLSFPPPVNDQENTTGKGISFVWFWQEFVENWNWNDSFAMIVGYADRGGTIVAIVFPTVVILVLVVGYLVSRRKLYQTVEVQGWLVPLEVNHIQYWKNLRCWGRCFSLLCAVGDEITTIHSVQFAFKTTEAATDKFSDSNMIGRGGFGEVNRV